MSTQVKTMQPREERSPGVPDVYRAISQVTKAISVDGIAKNSKNQQQGYSFRGIDDIYNALSALIAEAELCILPRMISRTQEERQTAKGGVLFYVTVQAEFDFVSARDASKHTVTMYGEAMDSGDKATNKAMSAAYKYCCLQVFCIPTEGMNDADATTHEVKPKEQQAPDNDLGATIRKAFEAQLKKFMDAGKPHIFKEVLGAQGYAEISEIPIDRDVAGKVINELKVAYADHCMKK